MLYDDDRLRPDPQVNTVVFGVIAFYRWCIENPDSRPASFAAGHFKHWNPPREDEL